MIVGLTGSIATGKSTVSRLFAQLGATIIDADLIVRQVQRPGEPAWREIVTAFGTDVLLENEELDRAKLGALVFGNAANRQKLNEIVHPHVRTERDRQTAEVLAKNPQAVVIWDIPLLIETGIYREVEKTIVVFVDPDTQLQRLLERDGLPLEQAQKRIAAQMPIAEKQQYADYLIDNRGTREESERQVQAIWAELMGLAAREPKR